MVRKWDITTSLEPREEGPYQIGSQYYLARNVTRRGEEYVYEFTEIDAAEYKNFQDIKYIIDKTIKTESTYSEGYNAATTLMDTDTPTVESATAMRPVLMKAVESLDDADAAVVADFFPEWDGNGQTYTVGERIRYDGDLYRCTQDNVSDPSQTPSDSTPPATNAIQTFSLSDEPVKTAESVPWTKL